MPADLLNIGKKTVQGKFVIPSGIRCTRASTISWCFGNIPEIGVITTKSISSAPRAGYAEPIYARYAPDSYINAVGLSNPGAQQFRRELERIKVPANKFLLVSIFGATAAQFVETAQALRNVADGFELNMSCPHAEGYGIEIGQRKDLVAEITAAVFAATGLPVIVKLSATVVEIGPIAKAAMEAGAAGITVSNTVGPATVALGNQPILSNKVGGLSGAAIRPLALRAVQRVREAIGQGPLVIGMGGIFTAEDARQFTAAGADLIGVGSALTGMNSTSMRDYFRELGLSIAGSPHQSPALPSISMSYRPARVTSRKVYHEGLFKLVLDSLPKPTAKGALAGCYFFLFIPGVGEKPFAIFDAREKSVVVRVAGRFTKHLATLEPGAELYLRGPYGRPFPSLRDRTVVLIGGGTGIASLYEIGQKLKVANTLHFMLGGRTHSDLFDLARFKKLGAVDISTNDGSGGRQGFVSELLAEWLAAPRWAPEKKPLYVICGPEPMVDACFRLLEAHPREDVWAAIEYTTSCGVGICGKCASPSGALTCIDGPFMPLDGFTPASGLELRGEAQLGV